MALLATYRAVSPLAAEEDERRQLPGLPGPRADDLDADPVRDHDVRALEARLPADPGGARQAGERDPGEHRGRRAAAPRRPTSCWTSTAQRLKEAREQADDIVARARKASEAAVAEATAEGKAKREELVAAARRDIEAETRRSLEQIRKEVADLTVLATEKVTRKSLDDDDQKRLVEEALAEVDFSRPGRQRGVGGPELGDGGDRPRIRRRPLRGGEGEGQARRDPRAARPVRRRARREPRPAGLLLQPLLLLGGEARRRFGARSRGPSQELVNFLELLAREAPDAGDLPHPRPVRRALGRGRTGGSR